MVREKAGITRAELAKRLNLPERIIVNIEMGEYINYNNTGNSIVPLVCVTPIENGVNDNEENIVKTEESWWQGVSDEKVKEEIMKYLSYVLNPPIGRKMYAIPFGEETPF